MSVNQNGVDVSVLHESRPITCVVGSITLDQVVQNAAQHAVNTRGGQGDRRDQAVDRTCAIAQNAGAGNRTVRSHDHQSRVDIPR